MPSHVLTCARPRLQEVPIEDWTCSRCIKDEETRQRRLEWEQETDEILEQEDQIHSTRRIKRRGIAAIIVDNEEYLDSEDEDAVYTTEREHVRLF